MIHIEKMTKDEKIKMYNKCTKAKLIEMLINCNEIIDNFQPEVILNEKTVSEANPKCDYCQSDNVGIVEIHCKDCGGYTVL